MQPWWEGEVWWCTSVTTSERPQNTSVTVSGSSSESSRFPHCLNSISSVYDARDVNYICKWGSLREFPCLGIRRRIMPLSWVCLWVSSKSFVEFQIVFTKIPLRTYVVPFVVAKLMSIYHFWCWNVFIVVRETRQFRFTAIQRSLLILYLLLFANPP
jgi:hypothetical protein